MSRDVVGIKEAELRKLAKCGGCHKGIGSKGNIFFWKITIDRYAFNHDALKSQQGLGMQIGGQLAAAMGPDEDLAIQIGKPVVISLCQDCLMTPQNLAAIEEFHSENDEDNEEESENASKR